MLANHDLFTDEMCDRLQTTTIGLGLVRLLQDAKRFDEARSTFSWLEEALNKPSQKRAKAKRIARIPSRSLKSIKIDAA